MLLLSILITKALIFLFVHLVNTDTNLTAFVSWHLVTTKEQIKSKMY